MNSDAQATQATPLARRALLSGLVAGGAMLLLPGCAANSAAGYRSTRSDAAARRLMVLSSERAFDRLTAPEGFWTSTVGRVALPVLFARPGREAGPLRNDDFRAELQHVLNRLAEAGAARGGPLVVRTASRVRVADPAAVLSGGRTAATTFLRAQTGPALVNAMIPAIEQAMRASTDPVLARALAALPGVTLRDAAHALAIEADNAVWYEVGATEAAIRQDPASSGDATLAAALRAAGG